MRYPLYDFAESANRTRAALRLPHATGPFVCRKANDKGALVRKIWFADLPDSVSFIYNRITNLYNRITNLLY